MAVSESRLSWITLASGSRRLAAWWPFAAAAAALVAVKFALYWWLAQPYDGIGVAMCQWDCEWYVHTIRNGWDVEPRLQLDDSLDQANWAFFPLYILLARAVRALVDLTAAESAMGVSLLCFAGFVVVSAFYRHITRPGSSPWLWVAFLFALPYSFYFFAPYTESLYLLLSSVALLALSLHRPMQAGVTSAVLSATRAPGIILVPWIAGERLLYLWRGWRAALSWPERWRLLGDAALPVALAPLGLFAFMFFLYLRTGDALAFSHIQTAWSRNFHNPAAILYWGFAQNDWYKLFYLDSQVQAYNATFALLGLIAAAWLAWRRRFLECWFCAASTLLPLATAVYSMPRYMAGNPVFLYVACDLFAAIPSRVLKIVLLLAGVALQVIFLLAWFDGAAFLY